MVVNFTWLLSALVLPVLLSTPVAARSPNFFKEIKGNETFVCNARGRFAHPTDCVSFFDCKRNPAHGGLSAIRQRCPPTEGFHHKLKKCISLKKLKGCNPRQGRTDTLSPELNPQCGGAASFFCADCQTLVHCIDGSAWTENCGASDFCAEGKADFVDAVCYPSEHVENCTCTGKSSYAPDPYDVTKFFHCDSEEAEPEFYHCAINREFDPETNKCVDLEGLPACTKQGDFAHPENCSKYYSCLSSRDGWLRKSHECGPKEMFSEVNSTCENPCSWVNSGDFACTREGRFRDVTDCRRFYVCIASGDSFITKKRSCPDKHHWQSTEEGGSSGKCVSDSESECTVVAPSKCVAPTEWCPSSGTGAEGSSNSGDVAATEGSAAGPVGEGGAAEESATEGSAAGPVAEGDAAVGSAAEGSASEGSASEGSASEGSAAGPVAEGDAAEGSAAGPVAEGDAAEGDAAEGSAAEGSASEGSAAGPVAEEDAAEGSAAGPVAETSTAEGSAPEESGNKETTIDGASDPINPVTPTTEPEDTDITTQENEAEENVFGNDTAPDTNTDPTSGTTAEGEGNDGEVTDEASITTVSAPGIEAGAEETTNPSNFVVRSGVEPSKKDDPIAFIRNLLNKNY